MAGGGEFLLGTHHLRCGSPALFTYSLGLKLGLEGLGFRVKGLGFRVTGFGFRVMGFGLEVRVQVPQTQLSGS